MTAEPKCIPLDSRLCCASCRYPLRGCRVEGACPECGRTIRSTILTPPDDDATGPINLHTARDTMEAHLLIGLLEKAGVPAQVMGESLATGRGDLPVTQQTQPSVWIDAADYEQAERVFIEFRIDASRALPEDPAPAVAWTCPGCGEQVDGHFAVCWNCETARPVRDD
jgi:hypothetical protein